MPPRLPLSVIPKPTPYTCQKCRAASLTRAFVPAPLHDTSPPPIQRHPSTQPPSHRRPFLRKTQLHRQYQAILRSTPLIVLFQHNNLRANEWVGIRRELVDAMAAVDQAQANRGTPDVSAPVGVGTRLQIVQTPILASAVKVVEFWQPPADDDPAAPRHGVSRAAYEVATRTHRHTSHGMEPLLAGPLALLMFPVLSPPHLAAALAVLCPSPAFPAPRRRARPSYHDPAVQDGLRKLVPLAARVEGRLFDMEGTRWIGGIEGGMDGLRAQLVAALQGVGMGVTGTLDAAARSLYVTVEGRKMMMEEEQKASE